MDTEEKSLYERIGGAGAVEAAVDVFYVRVLTDNKLSPLFEGIDMARLKRHQREFFTAAFVGLPPGYDAVGELKRIHSRLFEHYGLCADHFDLVAVHFVASLKQLKVPELLIAEAVEIVLPLRGVFEEGAREHAPVKDETMAVADDTTRSMSVTSVELEMDQALFEDLDLMQEEKHKFPEIFEERVATRSVCSGNSRRRGMQRRLSIGSSGSRRSTKSGRRKKKKAARSRSEERRKAEAVASAAAEGKALSHTGEFRGSSAKCVIM